MANNMTVKAKAAESAQNNGAGGSKLLLDGSKGRKGVWGTDVRLRIAVLVHDGRCQHQASHQENICIWSGFWPRS